MGCHFLLQRIFPTQELNSCLLYCRQILYRLSYEESHYQFGDSTETLVHKSICRWTFLNCGLLNIWILPQNGKRRKGVLLPVFCLATISAFIPTFHSQEFRLLVTAKDSGKSLYSWKPCAQLKIKGCLPVKENRRKLGT